MREFQSRLVFEIASELLTDNCKISSPILVTDDEKILCKIDFNSVSLRQGERKTRFNLFLDQCRGKLKLERIKSGSTLEITDCPELIIAVKDSDLARINIRGHLKCLVVFSSRVGKVHATGNLGQISFNQSQIGEVHTISAALNKLSLTKSKSCLFLGRGTSISEIASDETSESSLFSDGARIGFLAFEANIHLVAHQSKLERISLLKTKMAFVYFSTPGLASTVIEKSDHRGIFQIVKDGNGSDLFKSTSIFVKPQKLKN